VYGTPIALYQAISGQSLTGNDLSTTERYFNGIAAAVPVGRAAYKLLTSAMAELRIAASAGGIAADGKALMDFSQLSKAQKGVVGELLGAETVKIAMPGAQRLGRLGEVGSQGIDDLYKVTTANVDYVIVEYKFGTSPLGKTVDGLQMSDGWVAGSERVLNAVGRNEAEVLKIEAALRNGRVEKWVVHTDPAGGTSIWIVDAAGKYIKAGSDVVSKVLGVRK
jgi:filamentous hemagglutinin